ncbi:lysylphosphatidylglycerol synthase transmembrane domain-containing protein, partial [Streptomyces sp. NPDC048304]|uniref:lysylphosphatidylglycerol synthase transmembrane domain-containing protein n=1 Tax=Streptomyces sp. NPDC048304 TaxID=3154820 RepID=UPI0033E449BC
MNTETEGHARVGGMEVAHARVHDGGPAEACVYGAGTLHARVPDTGAVQVIYETGTGLPHPPHSLERPLRPSSPAPAQPSTTKRPALHALRAHFGTLAGAVILGALLWRLGTGVLVDGLRRIDAGTVLATLGIGAVTTVLSAWRWQLVARGLRIRLPLGPAVADYYRALFLNAALPGGILGDVHRAVRHGQSAGDLRRGVKAVVLERVAGQLALAVLAVAVLPTLPSPVRAQARDFAPLAALAVAGALAVGLAVRMNRAPSRRTGGLRAALGEARRGLFSRRGGPGIALSSAVVLAGHLAMFVVAARVAGSAASVAQLVPLAVLALVAMGLPLNVGGFGPREGVTAWAFGAAGLGASTGVAVAVVYGVLSFVASLPGVVVLAARWYAGLRAPTTSPAATLPTHANTGPAAPADTGPAARADLAPATRVDGPRTTHADTGPAASADTGPA